jgi:hypothetical protein
MEKGKVANEATEESVNLVEDLFQTYVKELSLGIDI